MNICLICLRTDRLLKVPNNVIKQFHYELCGLSVENVPSSSFCIECEYLLTKFYKFKQKCVKAQNIYTKWMSESLKVQLRHICKLLPAPSLAPWAPNPARIGNYRFEETEDVIDLCLDDEQETKHIKLELEQNDDSNNSDNLSDNTNTTNECAIKPEITETLNKSENEQNSPSETQKTTKTKRKKNETYKIKNESNTCKKPAAKRKTKKVAEKKEPKPKKEKGPSKKMIAQRKKFFEQLKEKNKVYESIFDIEYLTTHEMQVEEFEKRRTYECYLKAEHKCDICYQVFASLKFLEFHTKKWHTESEESAPCSVCKMWILKDNIAMSRHRTTHYAVSKCKLCPLVTYHRASAKDHAEWHRGKQFHCEQCNTSYKSRSVYRSHLGKIHRRGRHICEGCGRGFISPLGLNIHKNNSSRCTAAKHAPGLKEDGVRCDECDVTLPSQEVYKAHVADVHAKRRRGDVMNDSNGLPKVQGFKRVKRKRGQRNPMQVTCRVCGAAGTSYSWLQLHFKRHHPAEDMELLYADRKRHLCHVCGLGFSTVYVLRDHMNKHTGALPYACDLCPKRFRATISLWEHRKRHFPSTKTCSYCGKSFKTQSNLYSHMKGHIGKKDYICKICGKGFLHAATLNEHVRGVHHNVRRVRVRGGAGEGAGGGAGGRRKKYHSDYEDTDTD